MDREEAYWTREEQELFESCLLDQMTPAEKAGFESRMASDPTLKAKFLEFKALFGAIEEAGLRLAMDHFHEGVQDDGKERRLSTASRTVYRMAAAIAVLMTLGGIWYFYYPNDNERLFAAYYTPDPGLPTVMGNSDNYMFYEAMVDYKQEDYGTALQKWKGLLPGKWTMTRSIILWDRPIWPRVRPIRPSVILTVCWCTTARPFGARRLFTKAWPTLK